MTAPAKTATLLRTNCCQISVHWPAAAFDSILPAALQRAIAGAVSTSPFDDGVSAVIR